MIERILSNRYVLREVIGTGGMAVVYRAWDRVQLREVAVKVLRAEYNADSDFIRRFNHEAQAASQMSHPNIVNMYDVGQDGDIRYIVMEYVKGRTLKELIRQTGRIKPRRAVQMTLRILAAVDHAHKSHIVHRDIKPQNILVDNEGNVKVADFGIARATNANTQTYSDGESVLGSVHYFSPEQASGQVADEKSDLYSVGVVLYEMVTGEVPFDGDTPVAVALKHVQEAPRSTRLIEPEISKGLDEVIMKSLEKEASQRYQTAADMANDLKRAIRTPRGGFVGTPALSPAEIQAAKQEKRRRRQSLLRIRNYVIFTLALALVVVGVIYGGTLYREMFAKISMPNVTMLDVEDAVSQLTGLGLTYTIEERHNEDISYGRVISQYPLQDEPVWQGERVQLVVSIGKEKLMMPKLLENTRSEAVRILEENDLLLDSVILEVSDAEPGTVIAQEPAVNEWVKPGDKVTLYISGESATMPTLLGLPLEDAQNQLTSSGFVAGGVVEALSNEPEGTVIAQSVDPGVEVLLGTQVKLTVSQYQAVTYRAQTSVVVAVPEGGAQVRCTLEESGEEREVYLSVLESGNQTIRLDLDSLEMGTHTVRVYVDGKLEAEKQIEFS